MRKNTSRVLAAWHNGKANRTSESIWTDGMDIYSYFTCLVSRMGGRVVYNATKYSPTTSRHQQGIRTDDLYTYVIVVDNQRRGVCSGDLQAAADKRPIEVPQ